MVQTFSRRVFLGGLLSSAAGGALANAPTISLRPVLRSANGAGGGASVLQQPVLQPSGADAIVKAAGLSGEVSFAVADAKSGTMVESYKDATVFAACKCD